MKKSSILVTLFLVVALVFAVSCPSGFSVNVVGDADVSKEVTVGEEGTVTFDIEISNGAFLESAKDKLIDVKLPSDFDLSTTDKATATATISELGAKDASTGKITKATVKVLLTAKKVTSDAKEITFEIPAVATSENPQILEGVKDKVLIAGRKVLVKVVAKDATVTVAPELLTFKTSTISGGNTATITLQNAKWIANANPTITTDNGMSFSFVRTNDTVLTLSVLGTPTETNGEGKDYSFVINSSLATPDEGYKLPSDLKAVVKVKVEEAQFVSVTYINDLNPDTNKITINSSNSDSAIITVHLENAKWANKAFYWNDLDGLTFNDNGIQAQITRLDNGTDLYWRIMGAGSSGGTIAAAEKEYFFNINSDIATPDEGYEFPENFKASFLVTVQ